MSKEVTVKESTELMDQDLMSMMTVEAGTEEHLSKDELQIPILKIAQKGSAQVDKDTPEYIEGLEAGGFFNSSTGTVFGSTIQVQTLAYYRNFVIWEGAKGQGIYKGTLSVDEFDQMNSEKNLVQEGGDFLDAGAGENGADIRYTDTRNYALVLPQFPEEGMIVFAMSSTGIKPSKEWNSKNNIRMMGGQKAKRNATIWELTTGHFTKDNYSWKQVNKIIPLRWATKEEFIQSESFIDFARSLKESEAVKYSEDTPSSDEIKESDF